MHVCQKHARAEEHGQDKKKISQILIVPKDQRQEEWERGMPRIEKVSRERDKVIEAVSVVIRTRSIVQWIRTDVRKAKKECAGNDIERDRFGAEDEIARLHY